MRLRGEIRPVMMKISGKTWPRRCEVELEAFRVVANRFMRIFMVDEWNGRWSQELWEYAEKGSKLHSGGVAGSGGHSGDLEKSSGWSICTTRETT